MKNEKSNLGDVMKRFFLQSWSSAIVAIVLLVIVFSVTTESFLSSYNLFNLSRTATLYAFIAGAQLMVAVIGGMNLAVGAVGALSSVILGILLQDMGMNTGLAVFITICVGLVCGVVNGILVVKLKLSGFIITLAMSFIYDGLAVGISHGYPYTLPENLTSLGRAHVGKTSALFILMIIFVVILAVFFSRMRFGRNILATGGNEAAAALSGIKVDMVKIICNSLSCGLASLAAILWASRTGTAVSSTGSDWMLYSFAVCAIGGISLSGGNFTGVGFFCGAWILTMIRNGLTMMKVDIYYEQAFLGAIILIAVSVESIRTRLIAKMK